MDKNPYENQTKQYVSRLIEEIKGSVTVVLYGSMARGDYNLGSDVDLLVISDALPVHPLKRARFLFGLNHTNAPIEPKGYTTEEFKKLMRKLNVAALDSIYEGQILVDSGNWLSFKKEFEQVKKEFELERTRRGWVSHKALREARQV